MPAPSNVTALLATPITSLPHSGTQAADFGGTTYPLWYSYTPAVDEQVSIVGLGDDLVTYMPDVSIYIGPAAVPVVYLSFDLVGDNRGVQAPLFAGVTYYIEFATNSGNPSPANLNLEIEAFVQQTAPIGSILVNDDTADYPLVALSSADGTVLRFVQNFPNGEAADILETGISLWQDAENYTAVLCDTDLSVITTFSGYEPQNLGGSIRACLGTGNFWIAYFDTPNVKVRSISPGGAEGTAHTVTTADLVSIAVSNDESILYWADDTTGQREIQRFDLINNVPLSDFAPAVNNDITFDILVLADDTVLASHIRTTTGGEVLVKHYDTDGTVLQTYDFGDNTDNYFPSGTFPRIARAIDAGQFWFWQHKQTPDRGVSLFSRVQISDGTILDSFEVAEYELGIWQQTTVLDPQPRFGISFSCPFVISRTALSPTPDPEPPDDALNGPDGLTYLRSIGVLGLVPIVRQRTFPHLSDEQQRIFHRKLQIDVEAGVGTVSGQGILPDLRVRWSDDGGFTWSNGRSLGVGPQGAYRFRCITHQMGQARDRVYEITQSDPVKTVWLAAYLDIQEGLN